MAFHIPAQEDPAGTSPPLVKSNKASCITNKYLESLPYLSGLIKHRLVEGQPEGDTARAWDDILHEVFPGRDNYSTGPGMSLGRGQADLFTAHSVIDTKFDEKEFLVVVEYKVPEIETPNEIWVEGVDQLKLYLDAIGGGQRKFGAIAIGKSVRFYEWRGGVLEDIADGGIFYLDRQPRSIMRQLVYFREHHG